MRVERELAETIQRADTLPELGLACRGGVTWLGFGHFAYLLHGAFGKSANEQVLLWGYPKAWRARYDEQGYLLVDPTLSRAMTSVTPFGWDEIARDRIAVNRLFDDASTYGLVHGLSVPLHGFGDEFGVLSLSRQTPLPQGRARHRLFQRAQWLTGLVQARLKGILASTGAHQDGFTSPMPLRTAERAAVGG